MLLVDMGPVTWDPGDLVVLDSPFGVDLAVDFHGTHDEGDAAGMGNPHLVLFVDRTCHRSPLPMYRPASRARRALPEAHQRSSSCASRPALLADEVDMRGRGVRGAGETLSRGTGVCATAVVAYHRRLVGEKVTVHVPGGDLVVELGTGSPTGSASADPSCTCSTSTSSWTMVSWHESPCLTVPETDFDVLRQRVLFVGTGIGTRDAEAVQASLDELVLLVDTAGADPVELVLQRRERARPRHLHRFGQGQGAAGARRDPRRRPRRVRRRAHAR